MIDSITPWNVAWIIIDWHTCLCFISPCLLALRCECLPGVCTFPQCSAGTLPHLVSRGDGTPGRCCDVYECVNGRSGLFIMYACVSMWERFIGEVWPGVSVCVDWVAVGGPSVWCVHANILMLSLVMSFLSNVNTQKQAHLDCSEKNEYICLKETQRSTELHELSSLPCKNAKKVCALYRGDELSFVI